MGKFEILHRTKDHNKKYSSYKNTSETVPSYWKWTGNYPPNSDTSRLCSQSFKQSIIAARERTQPGMVRVVDHLGVKSTLRLTVLLYVASAADFNRNSRLFFGPGSCRRLDVKQGVGRVNDHGLHQMDSESDSVHKPSADHASFKSDALLCAVQERVVPHQWIKLGYYVWLG